MGLGGRVATTDDDVRTGRKKQTEKRRKWVANLTLWSAKNKHDLVVNQDALFYACFYVFLFCEDKEEDRITVFYFNFYN